MSIHHLLLVDDEALNLEILLEYFSGEDSGIRLSTATDGEQAWEMLQAPDSDFRLILLDRMMPGLDGISLLRRIKETPRLAGIPVILQTAAASPDDIRVGLEAGAYYYLTKPYRRDSLLAVVHAALSEVDERNALRRQLRQHIDALRFLDRADFSIRTLDEANQLATLIGQACPQPEAAVIGIAELLVNAVEHGNLGLTYAEKTRLKLDDNWQAEIERRAALPENRDKYVQVTFIRRPGAITLRIVDQGPGFDWHNYLEMSPERAFDPNGRGIALARMLSFTDITYENSGNIAVATIASPASAKPDTP